MNKKVVITKLSITQAGAIISFQVKIPRDAIRITGVNCTVTMGEPFAQPKILNPYLPTTSPQWIGLMQNIFLGDLRIQSYGKANIFIAEDVYLQDYNIGQGDFTTIPQFIPNDWSHKVKYKKVEIIENANVTVLKGIYRDRQAVASGGGYVYTVGVYVWYEINPVKI